MWRLRRFAAAPSLLLLLSNLAGIRAQLPSGACSAEEAACELQEDNLVGVIGDISSRDDCRQFCQETPSCKYFTSFGPAGDPFDNKCLLYSTCLALDACADCYTEAVPCSSAFCTAPVEGEIGVDNIVGVVNDVEDETVCEGNCQAESACAIYTYYQPNSSVSPSSCYLLSGLVEPIAPCDACVTGLPDCQSSPPICAYLEDGLILEQGALVSGGERSIDLLRIGVCPSPVAVAVGGGGSGLNGGGGSGYVNFTVDLPSAPYIRMTAHPGVTEVAAGWMQADSYLLDLGDNSKIVIGEIGGSGSGIPDNCCAIPNGGDGFSGGGGSEDSVGGNNGSPGQDGSRGTGGTGQGLDIYSIQLQHYRLSAGQGPYYHEGGGGGGVLVDGYGPPRQNDGYGEGYGGGGAAIWCPGLNCPGAGSLGMVLLDFVPEE